MSNYTITYYFGKYGDDMFDYCPDDINYAIASIITDEMNNFRQEQANKTGKLFHKIDVDDTYDLMDWNDAFDDFDYDNYEDELKEYYQDEAQDAYNESCQSDEDLYGFSEKDYY